jgi:hypothetical protein
MTKRKGKFSLPLELINTSPRTVLKILKDVIIVRAEVMYVSNSIEYYGISDQFDEISDRCVVPTYKAIIDEGIVYWEQVNE